MKFPEGTEFFDVEGAALARLPDGSCVFPDGALYRDPGRLFMEGTPISAEEFAALASEYNAA